MSGSADSRQLPWNGLHGMEALNKLAAANGSAAAYVAWRASVTELHAAAVGRGCAGQEPGPVDLLWRCHGEQGTKWFHRLGRPRPDAKVGLTADLSADC